MSRLFGHLGKTIGQPLAVGPRAPADARTASAFERPGCHRERARIPLLDARDLQWQTRPADHRRAAVQSSLGSGDSVASVRREVRQRTPRLAVESATPRDPHLDTKSLPGGAYARRT